jgi:hypothetical protein
MNRSLPVVAALAMAVGVAACVVEPVNPYPAPPPLQAEVVPAAPPGQFWEPGHWHWNGGAYVWIPGHYIVRAAGVTHWEHGHWANRGGTWVWIPGHWV